MYDKQPWGREVSYTSPTGIKTTLYNINVVALAIGRTAQTIRKWEVAGIIPKTPFKQKDGKRLYAKEYIDVIVEEAERSKLRIGRAIKDTSFSDRVYKRFEELNKQFFVKNDKEEHSNGKVKPKVVKRQPGKK